MSGQQGTHEILQRDEIVAGPSDQSFGRTFAIVSAVLGALSLWRGWRIGPGWFFGAAVFFGMASALSPSLLSPLNRAWLSFGLLLHKVTTPVIMGGMFFLVFTPMGVLMRAFGKDFLRLKPDPEAPSYWIPREPPGPAPETLKQQF